MPSSATSAQRLSLLFLAIATAVYTASLVLAGQLPQLANAGRVAIGMTLDMVVVVPAAFYWLVIRRRGWPGLTVVPVLMLSALAASRVLPADHQQPLHLVESLGIPLELGLIAWIVWRAARALRDARSDTAADPPEQWQRAALEVTGSRHLAAVLAAEIAVVYYGLASWRARPHQPAGMHAFTQHRKSGHAGMVFALLLVMAAEGIGAHLLLTLWSPIAAWIVTAGTAYTALWLIADYRATVLRPILVSEDALHLRAGFRCNLRLSRKDVAAITRRKPDFGKHSRNLTFLGTPTRWLTLKEPLAAQGPYGLKRTVRAVGIAPDQAEELDRVLAGWVEEERAGE